MSDLKIPIPNYPGLLWDLHFHDVVDSTNHVASNMVKDGVGEGQVILSDHQTSGRGRLDRQWIDNPGTSILMSILLRPDFPPEFFYLITSAFSVATLQILNEKYSIATQLKWPNDLMVSNKKIAGILAEAFFKNGGNAVVIVGIGINCNQSEPELELLGRPATSILIESGFELDLEARKQLAMDIASKFAQLYLSLREPSGRISVASMYRHECDTIGRLVRVEMVDETLVGVASDISVEGHLLVETDACMRAVPAGDVVHLYGE